MNDAFKQIRPLGDFLRVLIAPMIWFTHLVIVYAAEALICIGPPAARSAAMSWTVYLTTAAALIGLVVLAVGNLRPTPIPRAPDRRGSSWFLRVASLLLTLVSALAVIWTILPAAFLPVCSMAIALQR